MARRYKGFDGMDEFLASVDKVQREAPGYLVDELRREARQVVNTYKRRVTPVSHTGNLKKGIEFKKDEVYKKGMDLEAYVYDNTKKAPHFHLVERGHDQVVGPRKDKGGKVVGKVAGKYYFRNSVDENEEKFQRSRERAFRKILKGLEE